MNLSRPPCRLLGFISLFLGSLLLGCGPQTTPTPVATPLPSPRVFPTNVPTLVPVSPSSLPPTATAPLVPQLSAAVLGLLGSEAHAAEIPGWALPVTWAGTLFALPYRQAEGTYSLAVLNDLERPHTLYWDLSTEPATTALHWQVVRPLVNAPETNVMSFLGQDQAGQWWLGAVALAVPNQRPAHLLALLPLNGPDAVSYDYLWETVEGAPEFYVVENGTLRVYQWTTAGATLLYQQAHTPAEAVSPWRAEGITDVDGDTQPEVMLRWYAWGTKWETDAVQYQFLRRETNQYRSLGLVPPGFQYLDVNLDGVREFLYPQPAAHPTAWAVVAWDGQVFTPTAPLPRPVAPLTQAVDLAHLPALPADLYIQQATTQWRWPQAGGALQPVEVIPPAVTTISLADIPREGVCCASPSGRYALTTVRGAIEGSATGVYDTVTGQTRKIPDSFVYAVGWFSFAWDPQENFLVVAGADAYDGLFRLALPGGTYTSLLDLKDPLKFSRQSGAVNPFVFADGSVGFSLQGPEATHYPPPGVYRLYPDGTLQCLAALPPLAHFGYLGDLQWSADGAAFFYNAPQNETTATVLVGLADGSVVYDLSSGITETTHFRWGPTPP